MTRTSVKAAWAALAAAGHGPAEMSRPLELKLLGANLVIMAAAVLMLFGPVKLEPTRLTDALIIGGALGVAAISPGWNDKDIG